MQGSGSQAPRKQPQRLDAIRQRGFAELKAGRIWRRRDIERWLRDRGR
jgi:hypothetical protein